MNQTFDYGYQAQNPQENESWFSSQFATNSQFPNQQQTSNDGFPPQGAFSDEFNVPKNLNGNNRALDESKDGFLTGAYTNQPQQFNDFVSSNSTNINNGNGINSASASNYNSSDKSSPSSILNNIPLSGNDINYLNNEIQRVDESNLSEKELVDRRKAQNRAAQRAFRERKELKLKELEDKLNRSESDKSQLLKQLEELRKQNVVISTENKLLLQNGNAMKVGKLGQCPPDSLPKNSSFSFPSSDYHEAATRVKQESSNESSPLGAFSCGAGSHTSTSTPMVDNVQISKLDYSGTNLTITQVWEYLNEKNDPDLDIELVMEKIKGLEVCHEQGAAYPLKTIDEVIAHYS